MKDKSRILQYVSVAAVMLVAVVLFLVGRAVTYRTDDPKESSSATTAESTTTVTTTTTNTTVTTTTIVTTTTTAATTADTRDPAILDLIGGEEPDNEWALFLIDREHPLPDDYAVELTYIENDRSLDARVAPYYQAMCAAALKDGVDLLIIGGYRSVEYQRMLFTNRTNAFIAQGFTEEEAQAKASLEYAYPGSSEHNAGIAADIAGEAWYWDNQNNLPGFVDTPEYAWLVENSYKYGFILRYPADKTGITGIMYEPWHYRFVGVYHAARITELGVTLEEYLEQLPGDAPQ